MSYNNRPDSMLFGPISYHMSYTLVALTNSAGGSIRLRLTLIGELYSDIAAKAATLKGSAKEDIEEVLKEVLTELETLEDGYEPILDYNIHTYGKAAVFDTTMRNIRTALVTLIEKHNLCSKEDIEGAAMPSPAIRRRGE